jgi:iron complex transport system permease protein
VNKNTWRWIGLGALAMGVWLAALAVGPTSLTFAEWKRGVFGAVADPLHMIVWELRLPRVVLGALVGAALGLAGAAMQGFLRNPLAEPGVLGVSAGASLGAVIVFYTGLSGVMAWLLPAGAIIGAMLAAGLLLVLAGRDTSLTALVLAGMGLNALFGALTTLALNLSPNPFATMDILFWLMGSLSERSWTHVELALPFVGAGAACLLAAGPALRALSLGEETAASLGVDLRRTRWLLVAGTGLTVGGCTAVAGAIGFVGLLVPHALRPFVRSDPWRLLVASALGGAVFLPLADLLVRVVRTGPELRLGVVTALTGAPFFIWLLMKERRRWS